MTGLTVIFEMRRNAKTVAQVVELASGKCVVSWPTSVIVYDSLSAARGIHIMHMGGRGESTIFDAVWASHPDYMHGRMCAIQDDMEGCPFGTVTDNYANLVPTAPAEWDQLADPAAWLRGYEDACWTAFGANWKAQCAEKVKGAVASARGGGQVTTTPTPKQSRHQP